MSKTAQRKRQAYRDGYHYGLRNIGTGTVRLLAVTVESFGQGLAEGRRERIRVDLAMAAPRSLVARLLAWIAGVLA